MTRETLIRAMNLDRSIDRAEKWLKEIREAETICQEEKHTGAFCLKIKTAGGNTKAIDIPANAAMKAIESAKDEILKEKKRMSSIFEELH